MISWLFFCFYCPRFVVLMLLFYEVSLYQQRRKRKLQTYLAASKRSNDTGQPLLVLGRHPAEEDKHDNEIHVQSAKVEEYFEENNVDGFIIFESGVFTRNDNFVLVEECLRMKQPSDIFFLAHSALFVFCFVARFD